MVNKFLYKTYSLKTILILFLLFSFHHLSCARNDSSPGADDSIERTKQVLTHEIKKIIRETGTPSISIALVKDDKIIWTAAFGFANVRTKTPSDTVTMYHTGSSFKLVTATAVMQLVEQGKLALDDPVNKYLGDQPIHDRTASGKPVTLRHLLSHHSGLNEILNMVPLWGRRYPQTLEQLIPQIKAERDPGREFEYCNIGFALLGYIIGKVSGQNFDDFVMDHVLKPLHVSASNPFEPTPAMAEVLAYPYDLYNNLPHPEVRLRLDIYPAGDAYMTPRDMAYVLAAHLNNGAFHDKRILAAESIHEMHRIQYPGTNAGLGTFMLNYEDHQYLIHPGQLPGFSAYLIGDLDARAGVCIMSNAGGIDGRILAPLAFLAIDLLREKQDIQPLPSFATKTYQAINLPAATLTKYIGEYQLESGLTLTISQAGDQLFGQVPRGMKFEIFPFSETEFFVKIYDMQLRFHRDDSGNVKGLTLAKDGGVSDWVKMR